MRGRALIAGCGDVGTALGLLLAADGYEVVGVSRDPTDLPAPIRPHAADLTDPADVASLPTDVHLVAYTAAAGSRDPAVYEAVYVTGLRHVTAHLRDHAAPIERSLFTSSTAVHGQTDGSDVDEDSPTEPNTDTGRLLLDAEAVALDVPWRGLVLRLAGIYGPGRTRLIDDVRAGTATVPAEPTYTNRIHRDDAASAAHYLLTRVPDPAPIHVGVDDDPADRATVLRWLAGQLGAPPPTVQPGGSRRGANKRCRNTRLRATGWAPRYPTFREGYAALLADP